MKWTDEALAKLSHEDRHTVWKRAKERGLDELIDRVENSGPFWDPKGLQLDSASGRALARVIFSQAAKDAGAKASSEGRPALADVEPLIVAELGTAYTQQKEATVQAGYLVANMRGNNGFNKTGRKGPMPEGSVAKTAEIYKRKS